MSYTCALFYIVYSIHLLYTHFIFNTHTHRADLAGDPLPRGEIRLRLLRVLKTCAPFSTKPTTIGPVLSYIYIYARVCASLFCESLACLPTYLPTYEDPHRAAPGCRRRTWPIGNTVRSAYGILDASRRYFQASRLEFPRGLHFAGSPAFWIRFNSFPGSDQRVT